MRLDGFHRQVKQGCGERCRRNRDQKAGPCRPKAVQAGDDRDGAKCYRNGVGIGRVGVCQQRGDFWYECCRFRYR